MYQRVLVWLSGLFGFDNKCHTQQPKTKQAIPKIQFIIYDFAIV